MYLHKKKLIFFCLKMKETEGKYWPTVKQERWISHQQCWKGRGSWHFLHLCLYQHCWAPDLGNKNPDWCKHRPTVSEGRVGMWTITGAWPLKIDGPWQYLPKDVKRSGQCHCKATLHNLWKVMVIRRDFQGRNQIVLPYSTRARRMIWATIG